MAFLQDAANAWRYIISGGPLIPRQDYSRYVAPQVTTPQARAAMTYVNQMNRVPVNNAPVPVNVAPVPTSQPTQISNGMTEQEALNRGIDVNQLRREGRLIEGGGSGGMQQPNFDEIYNPLLSSLSEAERIAKQEQGLQEEMIGTESAKQKKEYENVNLEAEQQFTKQGSEAQRQKESALQEAYRAYAALNQQRRARFGAGSSAGEAVNQIGESEFYRNQGNVQAKYYEIYEGLLERRANVSKYIMSKMDALDEWQRDSKKQVALEYAKVLNQINSDRNQIQSAKAQAKYQEFQNTMQHFRNIDQQKAAAQIQLDTFRQSELFKISQGLVQIYQNPIDTQIQTPVASSLSPQQIASGALKNLRYYNGRFYDEFGNLVS